MTFEPQTEPKLKNRHPLGLMSYGCSESEPDYIEVADEAKLIPQRRFSVAQQAYLNSFYLRGMNSTSLQSHGALIHKAAKESNLTVDQVRVCFFIMRLNVHTSPSHNIYVS